MDRPVTSDELLALVAALSPRERARLIRLIAEQAGVEEATVYRTAPPRPDEFSNDEDPLAWEAEGWEEFD
jgi:hypothetical protein